jgi:signal peptidase I
VTAFRFIPWRDRDLRYFPLVALLVFVLAGVITLLGIVFSVTRVDGDSMVPTLEHGDRILVTRGYDLPRIGDIVSIDVQGEDGSTGVLKRVVALPGDTVEILGDSALVNGEPSEATDVAIIGPDRRHIGPLDVPDGMVYVLGDNRPVSLDSRYVGMITLGSVRGRVTAIVLPLRRARRIDGRP